MEVTAERSYFVRVRLPWGELASFETAGVVRAEDGSLSWPEGGSVGLSPRLDCILRETDSWVMGWLGGTCDTVAVISIHEDAPLP